MACMGSCSGKSDESNLNKKALEGIESHPCYSEKAHNQNARMHLPVAPKCNIQCNYCNRLYDCVNESRPGVTSEVLNPKEAFEKYNYVKEKIENLTVVGIAGPGDALANFEEVKESVLKIKNKDKNVIFCLSTNGLMLDEYADEIINLGINHVTITINNIKPEIGAKIYEFVNYKGKIYKGEEGAAILQENQFKGLKKLVDVGVAVKVNIVMIKGINEEHIPELVKKVKEYGAFMTNIMALIPAAGTVFENMPLVSNKELNELRNKCSINLKQMYHCQQCRADAIGLLKQDRSIEFRNITKTEKIEKVEQNKKLIIAIASKEGKLVDQHFGQVEEFYIYSYEKDNIKFIEKRAVEKYCNGKECEKDSKIDKILKTLKDCNIVLSVRIGYEPKKILKLNNIYTFETYDTIENGILYAKSKTRE